MTLTGLKRQSALNISNNNNIKPINGRNYELYANKDFKI
jgi:hypothetical protein